MCGEKRQELARPIVFPEIERFYWVDPTERRTTLGITDKLVQEIESMRNEVYKPPPGVIKRFIRKMVEEDAPFRNTGHSR